MAMAAALQLPLLFCGIDLADLGFYMTHYDQWPEHGASVEYNYMYWLTGVVGGTWHTLLPGLFSLRLLGLLCNLVCVWAACRIAEAFRPALAAALLVTVGCYGYPATFYYDTLTALLTVVSLLLMMRNHDAVSGMLMGLAVTARVSSLAGLLYLFIYLYNYLSSGTSQWKRALLWLAGWAGGLLAAFATMALLGDLPLFLDAMRELAGAAASESQEASHGLGNLIAAQWIAWSIIIVVALKVTVCCGLFVWLRPKLPLWLFILCMLPVAAYALRLIVVTDITSLLGAVTLAGCVGVLTLRGKENARLRCAAFAGLAMMAVMPLGSDGGIFNGGSLSLWAGLPVAMRYYMGRWKQWEPAPGTGATLLFTYATCAWCMVGLFRGGVYFDNTPLPEMKGVIHSERAAGIVTSKERADVINTLLDGLRKEVSAGDTLMVYGSAPTLNYLTGTQPFIGNSWPEQYTARALKQRLDTATGTPPVMIIKFSTFGSRFGNPSDAYAQGAEANLYHTPEKSAIVQAWLRRHGYRRTASTTLYDFYRHSADK